MKNKIVFEVTDDEKELIREKLGEEFYYENVIMDFKEPKFDDYIDLGSMAYVSVILQHIWAMHDVVEDKATSHELVDRALEVWNNDSKYGYSVFNEFGENMDALMKQKGW